MEKSYTKEDIKNISGIDYYMENCLYKPINIDIRILVGYSEYEKEALDMEKDIPNYIQFMIDRLKLKGGLPSLLIHNNRLLDGNHRILAYILSNNYIVNALERIFI